MEPTAVLRVVEAWGLTVRDLARTVVKRRLGALFVLLPILLLIAAVLALISSSGALAPFLYPLF